MAKTAILSWLTAILPFTAIAQGQVILGNNDNTSNDPFATSQGLFWISTAGSPVLINQDFNAAFYGGTDSASLSAIATFLLSDGTALHDLLAPGIFLDPTVKAYPIQGAIVSAFFQVQAWTGNFDSYTAAISAGAPAAQSPVFVNALGRPPTAPASLIGMPAMVLAAIPEPSTFVLVALGGLSSLLLCLCREKAAFDI